MAAAAAAAADDFGWVRAWEGVAGTGSQRVDGVAG